MKGEEEDEEDRSIENPLLRLLFDTGCILLMVAVILGANIGYLYVALSSQYTGAVQVLALDGCPYLTVTVPLTLFL